MSTIMVNRFVYITACAQKKTFVISRRCSPHRAFYGRLRFSQFHVLHVVKQSSGDASPHDCSTLSTNSDSSARGRRRRERGTKSEQRVLACRVCVDKSLAHIICMEISSGESTHVFGFTKPHESGHSMTRRCEGCAPCDGESMRSSSG